MHTFNDEQGMDAHKQPLLSHFPKLHVHVDMTNILLTFTLSKKVVDAVGNLK